MFFLKNILDIFRLKINGVMNVANLSFCLNKLSLGSENSYWKLIDNRSTKLLCCFRLYNFRFPRKWLKFFHCSDAF